jgi:flagellar hook-length control protein FliK
MKEPGPTKGQARQQEGNAAQEPDAKQVTERASQSSAAHLSSQSKLPEAAMRSSQPAGQVSPVAVSPAVVLPATALAARSEGKALPTKAAVAQADKQAATANRSTMSDAFGTAREAATAAIESLATPGALQASAVGSKSLAALLSPATEAVQAVKAPALRPSTTELNALPLALTALTALTAAPSATSAPTTAVIDTTVSQDVRRPEFVPVFSARIATLVQEGIEQARVHLNPVEMGPVAVELAMDGMQVRVDMTAAVAATRHALEQALPALASALREAGFTLSGGGVSPPGEASSTGNQDPRGANPSQGEPNAQTYASSAGASGQQGEGQRPHEAPQQQARPMGPPLSAGNLVTELQLDAQGRPQLQAGRGLVDTFA